MQTNTGQNRRDRSSGGKTLSSEETINEHMDKIMGESSCFFRIDSISFELWIDWTKSRGEVQIVEKGKGFRRWIKASRGVVVWILKSLEACCKWSGKKLFKGDVND